MNLKTIKITSFAGSITAIIFVLIDFRPRNANIVTYWYRKAVYGVNIFFIDLFPILANEIETGYKKISYSVQSSGKTALS